MGIFLQILTALIGGLAIFFRAKSKYKHLGYILGMLSCPCWVVLEIYYSQWYVLPINALYILGWVNGYLEWRKK